MQICRLYEKQLDKALELVWNVFEECDAPDYEEMGIRTFRHFISHENITEKVRSGEMVFFGAYDKNELIGVISMRSGFHISLLFEENPYLRQITVNASPYGKPAYQAMGFCPLSKEQKKDGMRFTPMRLDIAERR